MTENTHNLGLNDRLGAMGSVSVYLADLCFCSGTRLRRGEDGGWRVTGSPEQQQQPKSFPLAWAGGGMWDVSSPP